MNEISNISSEKKKPICYSEKYNTNTDILLRNIIFLSDVYGFLFRFRLGCRYRSDKGISSNSNKRYLKLW